MELLVFSFRVENSVGVEVGYVFENFEIVDLRAVGIESVLAFGVEYALLIARSGTVSPRRMTRIFIVVGACFAGWCWIRLVMIINQGLMECMKIL